MRRIFSSCSKGGREISLLGRRDFRKAYFIPFAGEEAFEVSLSLFPCFLV